ncbi:MAG: hypothetical protein WCE70_01565 [Rhodanobacteraceae bacterium]
MGIATLNPSYEANAWVTERLVEIAERHAQGRVVSSLEGGYGLDALRCSSEAHVAALLKDGLSAARPMRLA